MSPRTLIAPALSMMVYPIVQFCQTRSQFDTTVLRTVMTACPAKITSKKNHTLR